MLTNLNTVYDARKSFYGKAKVEVLSNGDINLISYDTHVATIYTYGKAEIYGTYSNTTLRHIKDFLHQNGFKVGTKKELIDMYLV